MDTQKKSSMVETIVKYSSSRIYRNLLGVFSSFIKPKLLTPELFGLWNILNIIPNYASYLNLGTYDLMRYLIPYHNTRKEYNKNNEIKSNVFYGSLYLSLLIVVGLVFISVLGDLNLVVRLGLLTMACIVIMEWYYIYYIDYLLAYQNFKLVISSNYIKVSITFFLSIILIYLFGIYGVYLTGILTLIVIIFYLKSKQPLDIRNRFKYHIFRDLVKKGFPIMIINFIVILLTTSDRIIISYFLGIKQLGYYGIASMVFVFLMDIPGAAREVVEPKLMQSMTKNPKEQNLKEYFFKPLINTAYFMPFLIGPVYFIFPLVISLMLPRYILGIIPTQILVLGGYFLALAYVSRGIIVANNWQIKASIVMAFALPVNIGLSIVLVKLGMGITGVALGSSISFLILFISLLVFLRNRCNYALQDWKENIAGLCWPFPIMCVLIILLEYISKVMHINDFVAAFANITIFYVIMYFVINCFSSKYLLLKEIKLNTDLEKSIGN